MTFKELKQTYDKPMDRIKHMSNGQIVLCTFAMFMFMVLATAIIFPLTKGMPFIGMPKEKSVVKIEVTDTRKSDEVIVTEDRDLIYFAHNVTGYLNYSFAKVESEPEDLFITIKYYEQDGTVTEVSASENYVFWKGEYHKLMQPGVFTYWTEGVFYDKTVAVTK